MARKLTQMSIKLVVLVCLVALPAASFADGSVTSDSTAKIRVERELTRQGLAHSGLMVSVDDHIATLSGNVLTLAEKDRAAEPRAMSRECSVWSTIFPSLPRQETPNWPKSYERAS
jgi:hypothetical protein